MIRFKIDQSSVNQVMTEINNKFFGVQELTKPRTLEGIAKASFTITGKRFVAALDKRAQINPKKYHHIYEWNQIGSSTGRLFFIRRAQVFNGTLVISTELKRSRKPVPIPKELQSPGRTGKSVMAKHIFRNKAEVMENGQSITFQTKRTIAFLGSQGIRFIPEGQVIRILNPGGRMVKNAFREFALEWYRKNFNAVLDTSGIFQKIQQEVTSCLNRTGEGPVQARQTIANITERYSEGLVII